MHATFGEDSLRVLRALQFAARFEFTLDPSTAELCRAIPLDDLPAERVWGEMEKLLLQAARPSLGFTLALELGVIDRLFPELKAMVGCPQEPEWHPEGDVWVHTLLVIDEARKRIDDLDKPRQITVMLGAVLHDAGKPPTTAFIDGRIRSMDHEQQGVAPASAVLDRLNVQTIGGFDVRFHVLGIVAHHLKPGHVPAIEDTGVGRCLPPAGAEGRSRAAGAGGEVRLRGTRRRIRLFRDGLVPRTRARARCSERAAEAAAARPASARPRV